MEEQRVEYLKELIEYFVERHSIPEEDMKNLFHRLSIIYLNAAILTESQTSLLINIFISSNPNEPLSTTNVQLIQDTAVELEDKCQIEEIPFLTPDIEYLQDDGESKTFLSASKKRYVFKQTKNSIKVKEIVTNSPLIEGGVKLLFKRW